ncbi:HdeD family acid-resistance protein [Pseudonocardia saturnea]
MSTSELDAMTRGVWWLVFLRGALAVVFGLIALFTPGTALLALVFVFAAYAVLDGVTAVVAGLRHRRSEAHWVWHVVQGVISVVAGVVAVAWPGVTVLVMLLVIAFWSIVGGVAEITEAVAMRRRNSTTWGWMLAAGILSVVFGIVLVVQPGAALVTLLWLVGAYAVLFGVIVLVWAVRLRRPEADVPAAGSAPDARPSS